MVGGEGGGEAGGGGIRRDGTFRARRLPTWLCWLVACLDVWACRLLLVAGSGEWRA